MLLKVHVLNHMSGQALMNEPDDSPHIYKTDDTLDACTTFHAYSKEMKARVLDMMAFYHASKKENPFLVVIEDDDVRPRDGEWLEVPNY
jgi:hypothetical protein